MGTLSRLRRLHHHLLNDGTCGPVDTDTLSLAISKIESLEAGGCRNNCRTAKEQWTEGYQRAMMDYHALPLKRETLEAQSKRAWKENKDGV